MQRTGSVCLIVLLASAVARSVASGAEDAHGGESGREEFRRGHYAEVERCSRPPSATVRAVPSPRPSRRCESRVSPPSGRSWVDTERRTRSGATRWDCGRAREVRSASRWPPTSTVSPTSRRFRGDTTRPSRWPRGRSPSRKRAGSRSSEPRRVAGRTGRRGADPRTRRRSGVALPPSPRPGGTGTRGRAGRAREPACRPGAGAPFAGSHRGGRRLVPARARPRRACSPSRPPQLRPHPRCAGLVRRDQGRHDEAAELIGRAQTIQERALGPDHPLLIPVLSHAADLSCAAAVRGRPAGLSPRWRWPSGRWGRTTRRSGWRSTTWPSLSPPMDGGRRPSLSIGGPSLSPSAPSAPMRRR